MKKIAILTLFVLGIATSALSNEPPTIDGTYMTMGSFEYNYSSDKWVERESVAQLIEISIQNGTLKLGDQIFTIHKMKVKMNKKSGYLNYEFKLQDVNGEWAEASFIVSQDQTSGSHKPSEFYIFNSGAEISYDIQRYNYEQTSL